MQVPWIILFLQVNSSVLKKLIPLHPFTLKLCQEDLDLRFQKIMVLAKPTCLIIFIFVENNQFYSIYTITQKGKAPLPVKISYFHIITLNQPFDVFIMFWTQSQSSIIFGVMFCNIRYGGWLDSCNPLKLKEIMSKTDSFFQSWAYKWSPKKSN